jgi:hypothetical protein
MSQVTMLRHHTLPDSRCAGFNFARDRSRFEISRKAIAAAARSDSADDAEALRQRLRILSKTAKFWFSSMH